MQLMPVFSTPSQVWMHRMMENMSSELKVIVVDDTGKDNHWQQKIPAYSVQARPKSIRYLTRLFSMGGFTFLKNQKSADRLIKSLVAKYEISHIFCQFGTYAVNFMKTWEDIDTPLFVMFHGYDAHFDLCFDGNPSKLVHSGNYLSNLKKLENRATFIVNSEFTKSLLTSAGLSESNINLMYYGIPVSEMGKEHRNLDEVQILHLGRLVDFKSPDRTIKAFEIAKSRGMKGRLVIAGDGTLRTCCELLKAQSPYTDSIQLTGAVSRKEAQNLISTSDIYTQHNIKGELTKQSECFGVSIVEAMAAGIPVVGTKSGGVLETVVDGETGIVNSPGDVEAQAEALMQLAGNHSLRQKMGDAARERVENQFNLDLQARRLKQIFNSSK